MRGRGFTLVELVIAMFIAAIMFAIGYGAINQALRDRDGLESSQARVTEIQRGMRIVAQDFAQIIARPARDLQGTGELVPAVIAKGTGSTTSSTAAGAELITFTRGGWSNPAGVQRPAEERVRYAFVDGTLVRDHWLSVDPALNAEPRERVLFTKVKSVELRFLDPSSRTWRTEWPSAAAAGTASVANPLTTDILFRTRPLEVEITIVFEDWGRIMRIFEIPT
jgi:general secretion pathway protein J